MQKPEDLICCLAREMNLKVVVAHHSIAAQTGKPSSPRVMLYSQNENGELNFAASINGGESDMPQGDSVEVMFNNSNRQEVEYYDIPFNEENPQRRMSSRNPESCMACHGTGGGRGQGGPRTLFDSRPWQRYIQAADGGPGTLDNKGLCPQEDQLRKKHTLTAMNALQTNPRFKCIDRNIQKTNVLELDELASELNNRRIARFVQSSPDYNKFKYIYLGLDLCDDALTWIPPQQLSQMNNENLLRREIQGSSPRESSALIQAGIDRRNAGNIRLGQNYDRAIAKNTPFFSPQEGLTTCRHTKQKAGTPQVPPSVNPTHHRYMVEEMANGRGANLNMDAHAVADYRFLFESRGMDISNWSMSPTNAYTRRPFLLPWLAKSDTANSRIGRIFSGITDFSNITDQKKRTICSQLKQETQNRFNATPVLQEETQGTSAPSEF